MMVRRREEERGDDTVCDGVKLGDGGANCRCEVSVFFFVSLGPDAAQAVERHHFDKEVLVGRLAEDREIFMRGKKNNNQETEKFKILPNETYSV